jgi:hypothetical protein
MCLKWTLCWTLFIEIYLIYITFQEFVLCPSWWLVVIWDLRFSWGWVDEIGTYLLNYTISHLWRLIWMVVIILTDLLLLFLVYFPYFEIIKEGLWDHLTVRVSVSPPPDLKAGILEPDVMAIARQWLSKHITMATNIHPTTEELLDAMFSMWSKSYQILNM